jgi:hypothetical protein
MSGPDAVEAARILVRSTEGLIERSGEGAAGSPDDVPG